MAADKVDQRDGNWRPWFPWREIFRGFQVAMDWKKLLLAAAGLVVMSFGWWLLAVVFYSSREEPQWGRGNYSDFAEFHRDRLKWDVLYEAAGPPPPEGEQYKDWLAGAVANDKADNPQEFEEIKRQVLDGRREVVLPNRIIPVTPKAHGTMRTWPWFEDRGPNPYMLVTGQARHITPDGVVRDVPWDQGHFGDWLLTKQVPVLIEPLVNFLRPIRYLLHPDAGALDRIYFFLALIWALATWALFGGAITRIAAVQIARKEKIGLAEAVRFTLARYMSFFFAPLIPLLIVAGVVICLMIFGLFHMIPVFGDIVVDGLGWFLVIVAGVAMAFFLIGLVGWPMMYATISAEGSDSFDALSRSYSYVYQSPWHYLWYGAVALVYGALVVFFVGFVGSLVVYLGKWGVSQTPFVDWANRDPQYLYIYAPTSFGWRDLLLHGSPDVTSQGVLNPSYVASLNWWNRAGAVLVAAWLYLVFLAVVGFAYSFFWSASTIIYFLMRRKVDDTDLDEVYLEDDETEDAYPTAPSAATSAGIPGATSLTVVDAPGPKGNTGPTAPPITAPRSGETPHKGDGGSLPPGSPTS